MIRVSRGFRGLDNLSIRASADTGYVSGFEQLAEGRRIDPWRHVDGAPKLGPGYGIPEYASGTA